MDIITYAMAKKAGGGSSAKGILVGNVRQGGAFPTQRPNGDPLQVEDYVRPVAPFPFDLTTPSGSTITFTSTRDKAYYTGSDWIIDPGVLQDTKETPVFDKTVESLAGTSGTQYMINRENVTAIKKKVDMSTDTTSSLAYTRNAGVEGTTVVSDQSSNSTIAKRTSTGNIFTATPTEDLHAATKKYVDDIEEDKVDKAKTDTTNYIAYTRNAGTEGTTKISETLVNDTIVKRTTTGTAQIATPVNNNDIANKKYVDDADLLKVDKGTQTTGNYAYTRRAGTEGQTATDVNATANTLAERYTDGRLAVGTPVADVDAVTKEYADEELEKKVDKSTDATSYLAYTRNANVEGTTVISTDKDADTLAKRYDDGKLKVGTATTDGDAVNKKYLEDQIIDNLTTDEPLKILSAKQGKVLEDTKLDITFVKSSNPTTADAGQKGQFWLNGSTNELFILEDISGTVGAYVYTWTAISGGGSGIYVGTVTNGATAFPTTRLDGSTLKANDYVQPATTSTFPFTVDTVTFTNVKDKAVYSGTGTSWTLEPGVFQDTSETPLADDKSESLSESANNQAEANIEFVERFGRLITFKGYISNGFPSNPKSGDYCRNTTDTTMPTPPFDVQEYDGSGWSAIATSYTPSNLDMWANLNDDHEYYWFNSKWNALDSSATATDDVTIHYNSDNKLEVKDSGLTVAKFDSTIVDDSTETLYTTNDTHIATSKLIANTITNIPDNTTIQFNSSNKLEVKDGGLTVVKFDSTIVDDSTKTLYETDDTHIASSKLIAETIRSSGSGFKYKGFITTTTPASAKKEQIWYNNAGTTMPTTFPIPVKTYDGSAWSSTYVDYTPSDMDILANANSGHQYYWYGTKWNILDVPADDTTIQYNADDELEVKDGGLTVAKFDPNVVDVSTGSFYITDDTHVASSKLISETFDKMKKGFDFRGYVSPATTEPTGASKGQYWYASDSETMPTTFPIQVKTYDGTAWSSTSIDYTPNPMDLWSNLNSDHGFYWFGNKWNRIDFDATVDDVTIHYNSASQLEVKDAGITLAKLATQTAADETKVAVVQDDGTWALDYVYQYKLVDTLDPATVDGNTHTWYYLTTAYSDGTKSYAPGSYYWTVVDGYVSAGSTTTGTMYLGLVTSTSTFPTQRPDSTALVMGDYVKPDPNETFPFTIDTVTFTNARDQAVFMGGTTWILNASPYQATQDTPVSDKTTESIKGATSTVTTQQGINQENATAINSKVTKLKAQNLSRDEWVAKCTTDEAIIAGYGTFTDEAPSGTVTDTYEINVSMLDATNFILTATNEEGIYTCTYDGTDFSDWKETGSNSIHYDTELPTFDPEQEEHLFIIKPEAEMATLNKTSKTSSEKTYKYYKPATGWTYDQTTQTITDGTHSIPLIFACVDTTTPANTPWVDITSAPGDSICFYDYTEHRVIPENGDDQYQVYAKWADTSATVDVNIDDNKIIIDGVETPASDFANSVKANILFGQDNGLVLTTIDDAQIYYDSRYEDSTSTETGTDDSYVYCGVVGHDTANLAADAYINDGTDYQFVGRDIILENTKQNKLTISTSAPSDGDDKDLWVVKDTSNNCTLYVNDSGTWRSLGGQADNIHRVTELPTLDPTKVDNIYILQEADAIGSTDKVEKTTLSGTNYYFKISATAVTAGYTYDSATQTITDGTHSIPIMLADRDVSETYWTITTATDTDCICYYDGIADRVKPMSGTEVFELYAKVGSAYTVIEKSASGNFVIIDSTLYPSAGLSVSKTLYDMFADGHFEITTRANADIYLNSKYKNTSASVTSTEYQIYCGIVEQIAEVDRISDAYINNGTSYQFIGRDVILEDTKQNKITISTSTPSGGADKDLWVYKDTSNNCTLYANDSGTWRTLSGSADNIHRVTELPTLDPTKVDNLYILTEEDEISTTDKVAKTATTGTNIYYKLSSEAVTAGWAYDQASQTLVYGTIQIPICLMDGDTSRRIITTSYTLEADSIFYYDATEDRLLPVSGDDIYEVYYNFTSGTVTSKDADNNSITFSDGTVIAGVDLADTATLISKFLGESVAICTRDSADCYANSKYQNSSTTVVYPSYNVYSGVVEQIASADRVSDAYINNGTAYQFIGRDIILDNTKQNKIYLQDTTPTGADKDIWIKKELDGTTYKYSFRVNDSGTWKELTVNATVDNIHYGTELPEFDPALVNNLYVVKPSEEVSTKDKVLKTATTGSIYYMKLSSAATTAGWAYDSATQTVTDGTNSVPICVADKDEDEELWAEATSADAICYYDPTVDRVLPMSGDEVFEFYAKFNSTFTVTAKSASENYVIASGIKFGGSDASTSSVWGVLMSGDFELTTIDDADFYFNSKYKNSAATLTSAEFPIYAGAVEQIAVADRYADAYINNGTEYQVIGRDVLLDANKENRVTIATTSPAGEETDLWAQRYNGVDAIYQHGGVDNFYNQFYKITSITGNPVVVNVTGWSQDSGATFTAWGTNVPVYAWMTNGYIESVAYEDDWSFAGYLQGSQTDAHYDYKTTITCRDPDYQYELQLYSSDEWNKIAYLPTRGGTITGDIKFDSDTPTLYREDSGGTLILTGGNKVGARLELDAPDYSGNFRLTADRNLGDDAYILSGEYDGTLTWGSDATGIKDILTEDSIVDNLTSTDTDKSLSAKQGKLLQDNKEKKVFIQDTQPTGAESTDLWLKKTLTKEAYLYDGTEEVDYWEFYEVTSATGNPVVVNTTGWSEDSGATITAWTTRPPVSDWITDGWVVIVTDYSLMDFADIQTISYDNCCYKDKITKNYTYSYEFYAYDDGVWNMTENGQYLPLTGGTMTGNILSALTEKPIIACSTNNNHVVIKGGTPNSTSPFLKLYGGDVINSQFVLGAVNPSIASTMLIGNSTGDLTWCSHKVLTTNELVDNLTSTDTNKALTANQGKVLKTLIDGLTGGVKIKVVATQPSTPDNNTIYYIGASNPYQVMLYTTTDGWTDLGTSDVDLTDYSKKSDIVNNLTSTDTDKPLSANQGKILQDTKEKKVYIQNTQPDDGENTDLWAKKTVTEEAYLYGGADPIDYWIFYKVTSTTGNPVVVNATGWSEDSGSTFTAWSTYPPISDWTTDGWIVTVTDYASMDFAYVQSSLYDNCCYKDSVVNDSVYAYNLHVNDSGTWTSASAGLPTTGGTMTGGIVDGSSGTILSKSVDNSTLTIKGGTASTNSASLALNGGATSDGKFTLSAGTTSATSKLVGTANGKLYWCDNLVAIGQGRENTNIFTFKVGTIPQSILNVYGNLVALYLDVRTGNFIINGESIASGGQVEIGGNTLTFTYTVGQSWYTVESSANTYITALTY